MIYSSDGNAGLEDLADVVEVTINALSPMLDDFDSIAVTGLSGVIVGSPVALRLGKPLVVVRKENDSHHIFGGFVVNKNQLGKRYLFLDDFCETGATRERVEDGIRAFRPSVKMIGAYYYEWKEFVPYSH